MADDFSLMLAKMRDDFQAELPNRCDRLEEAVMALERGDPDAFDELFRQVHSLKGTGGTFGMQIITSICHDLETFITRNRARFGTSQANYSLSYIDLLRRAGGGEGVEAMRVDVISQQLDRLRATSMPSQKRVLLVEPSMTSRLILTSRLADMPIDLVMLEQGLYAMSRLDAENFDVFVCSGEMPDMKGIELIALLRESDGKNCRIPVVLVTSNPPKNAAQLGIRAVVKRDPQFADHIAEYLDKLLE